MKLIKDYINRPGYHCCTTSMRDIFEYNGYKLSESMVFGLDSGLGFNVIETPAEDNTLLFLGGKRSTFDGSICETLGIGFIQTQPLDDESAWEEVKRYIDMDIPVMVLADAHYLDYFKEPPDHFGVRMLVLVGYDLERNIVFTSERKDERLKGRGEEGFYHLSIPSLKMARASECKYPFQPQRRYFVFKFSEDIDIKGALKKAILKNMKSFIECTISNGGLESINSFPQILSRSISTIYQSPLPLEKRIKRIRKQLLSISVNIETVGTGGGLFRKMYADFLQDIYQEYFKDGKILEASECFLQSSNIWTELAEYLFEASSRINEKTPLTTIINKAEGIKSYTNKCLQIERKASEILLEWAAG